MEAITDKTNLKAPEQKRRKQWSRLHLHFHHVHLYVASALHPQTNWFNHLQQVINFTTFTSQLYIVIQVSSWRHIATQLAPQSPRVSVFHCYQILHGRHFSRQCILLGKHAHYVYTNTRSCPPDFPKLTRVLESWAQELFNGIWHAYIGQIIFLKNTFAAWRARTSCNTTLPPNSCPPDFMQWACLISMANITSPVHLPNSAWHSPFATRICSCTSIDFETM